MSLGAALVGLGELDGGREWLRAAITRGMACGQRWAAAMAQWFLARSYLVMPDPEPAVAMDHLRSALALFRSEEDVSAELHCFFTGAWALVLDGRTADAARLRAAVLRHARRRGLQPQVTDPVTAGALDAALGPADRAVETDRRRGDLERSGKDGEKAGTPADLERFGKDAEEPGTPGDLKRSGKDAEKAGTPADLGRPGKDAEKAGTPADLGHAGRDHGDGALLDQAAMAALLGARDDGVHARG
jgi:hypothetical protein